jgi:mannose-6-phosphate isomerase-like protein (cupin superfamily)
MQENLARMRSLIETIDKTIKHLKGTEKMKSEEMFLGFSIDAGKDRFGEHIQVDGQPSDCKVSAQDTRGAMCVFELTGGIWAGPRHLHHDQDEWIYVIDGEFEFEVGDKKFRVGAGESVFIPRKASHVWTCVSGRPGKIIDVYQPAGRMEEFFRELAKYNGKPYVHEALSIDEFRRLFHDYGMDLVGPPLAGKWKVEENARTHRSRNHPILVRPNPEHCRLGTSAEKWDDDSWERLATKRFSVPAPGRLPIGRRLPTCPTWFSPT